MWQDPIVSEIRRVRDEYAARFNYDIRAICGDAVEAQKKEDRPTVRLPSKRPLPSASTNSPSVA
jgi:hypothetical protein